MWPGYGQQGMLFFVRGGLQTEVRIDGRRTPGRRVLVCSGREVVVAVWGFWWKCEGDECEGGVDSWELDEPSALRWMAGRKG